MRRIAKRQSDGYSDSLFHQQGNGSWLHLLKALEITSENRHDRDEHNAGAMEIMA
jgi:hypothetical protein